MPWNVWAMCSTLGTSKSFLTPLWLRCSLIRFSKIVFDLGAQWPVRHNRFWCLMLPDDLPELTLQAWPTCPTCTTLGSIMPFDAVWPDEQEADLKWDEHEMAIFFDPQYGNDMRMLQTQSKAPTMLHSWAHLLRACPSGCRTLPIFTEETSAERGTWIWNFLSKDFNQVRRCPSTTSF
jgi:hypothetical protein